MDCLNCGNKLYKSDIYCPSCSQAASTSRLKTSHVFHNLLRAFTHTDKGFFYLIAQLLIKPGIIAKEYTQGKRKSYFSPFSYMVLILAINTILVSSFNLMSGNLKENTDPINNFLNKYFNIVIFIAIPLMAYFTNILFKKKNINFAESMVIGCYTSGERSVFHILIVTPLIIFFREYYAWIISIYLIVFTLYYAWACCQYFTDYKFWTFVRGVLAVLFCQMIITL